MPPLPDVPGVTKIEVSGVYHDAHWTNIWYTSFTGASPTDASMGSYVSNCLADAISFYCPEMSVDNEVTDVKGTDLTSSTGATGLATGSGFGARTGDFTPASACVVASMNINRRYRGGHPRKYLPWGTAGTYATGSAIDWDPSFIADCDAKLNSFMAGLVGVTYGGTTWNDNVNVSYRNAGAVRVTAVVDTIQGQVCRQRICSQRRRLGRIGG